MADEEINNQEENQEETIDQEELAKQWEEQLAQQGEGEEAKQEEIEGTVENTETAEVQEEPAEETVDQDELAKQWEQALAEQQLQQQEEINQDDLAKQWEEALAEQQSTETSNLSIPSVEDEKLQLLLDIPLEITVEVGNKSIPIEDILKMTPNTIIELERYIGEPVDIKVNGKLIAKGELYTVENNFGVKITSIITVQERMRLLMEEVE